jgi:hypothetical protein
MYNTGRTITTIPTFIHNQCPDGKLVMYTTWNITILYSTVLYSTVTVHIPLTSAMCSDGFGVPPVWILVYNSKFVKSNNRLLFLAGTWVTNVQYSTMAHSTIYHVISHKHHMILMHMVLPPSGRIAVTMREGDKEDHVGRAFVNFGV